MREPAERRALDDDVAAQPVERFAEHAQPPAHDADDDEDHRRAEHDGDQRDPRDAALAEVFEDEVEFVHACNDEILEQFDGFAIN